MRTMLAAISFVAATVIAAQPAAAWDGPSLWYLPADGANPGGGGILGTGGSHDHGIKCGDCHVEPEPEVIDLQLDFVPALGAAGPDLIYAPGQRYRVDVRMLGAALGPPCDQYARNIDGFAASFETEQGAVAGRLESDLGQDAASCPASFPDPVPTTGSTGIYRDCAVVFSTSREDMTAWTFFWTAPATGTVVLHWGGVDGDCDMMSMHDAVVAGSRVLRPAPAIAASASPPLEPRRRSGWPLAVTIAGLFGLVIVRIRKR